MANSEPVATKSKGWLNLEERADALLLTVGGHWTLRAAEHYEAELRALQPAGGKSVRFDLGRIDSLDTAGAWLLYRLAKRLRADGVSISFDNVSPAHADMLERMARLDRHIEVEPPRPNPVAVIVARVGRGAVDVGIEITESLAFFGQLATSVSRLFVQPQRFRVSAVVYHMEQAGLNALPIVALISFLIGVVIAYQGAVQLRQFGAEIFVVDLVAISVLRELGILLTAIILAGRSGSAFTAEIGAMKINEEIDAMRTLGLDPMQVLVLPRLVALVITLPLLGFFADLMGLLGGGVMSMIELNISPAQYVERLGSAFQPWSFGVGLIKAPVFAAIVALTGCYMGLQVSGSAESVGRNTTRSVVHAIFAVIVVDAVFSVVFAYLGI